MGFSFLPLHIFRKRASWLKPILGFRFEARNWLQFRPPPAAKMRHRCLQKRQPCFEYPPAPSGRKSLLCLHPLSLAAATYTDIFCHLDCFHPSAGKFLLDRQGLQSLSGIAQTLRLLPLKRAQVGAHMYSSTFIDGYEQTAQ